MTLRGGASNFPTFYQKKKASSLILNYSDRYVSTGSVYSIWNVFVLTLVRVTLIGGIEEGLRNGPIKREKMSVQLNACGDKKHFLVA